MNRLTFSFLASLLTGAVSAGESIRGLAALRDGGSWVQAVVTCAAGLILFLSLVVLSRITIAVGRSQRRKRLKAS